MSHEVNYEWVSRYTINNASVLEIWDHLLEWLKTKTVRGAVAFEKGAGGQSPHLDITVQWQPMSYAIQSANIREVLCRKIDAKSWSIKKHKVKPPTHRYELLCAGYARKECENPDYRYAEWGNEGLDFAGAEAEYKQRVKNIKAILVHSSNWWPMCLAFCEGKQEPIDLRAVIVEMFNTGKYDMKYLIGKITYEHIMMFNKVANKQPISMKDFDQLFLKVERF